MAVAALVAGAAGVWMGHRYLPHRTFEQILGSSEADDHPDRGLPASPPTIPELIIEVNRGGMIQFLNESACNLLLLTAPAESMSPVCILDLVTAMERPAFSRFLGEVLAGELPTPQRIHLKVNGGESIPVRAIAAPILANGQSGVIGMRAVFTDLRGEFEFRQVLDQHRFVEITLTGILKALTMADKDGWEQALNEALANLSQLVPLEACTLLKLNDASGTVSWEYRWGDRELAVNSRVARVTKLEDLPWLAGVIASGKLVHVARLNDLPAEAQVERERWTEMKICSLLAIPMYVEGAVTGLMAFETVTHPADWEPEAIRLLETLTGMIASTWHQRESAREERATTQKLEDIIEFLPDATFVVDSQGCVVAWNKAMANLTGKKPEDILGQGDRAYALPLYGERVPLLVDHFSDADLTESAEHYHFVEMVGANLCGETFVPFLNEGRGAYLWCTASPLYDGEGNIVGAIESLRDVTYRKAAELALREGEERYRRLVETMNEGMGIVDDEGHIVFVNDRLCDMTGYLRAELLDRNLCDFIGELASSEGLESWPGWHLPAGEALEVSIPRRDGSTLPVRLTPSALFGEDGAYQGGFAVVADMTSIREAEDRYRQLNENLEKKVVESTRDLLSANAALQRSESRFRRLIENLREGYVFYSLDTSGSFTYLSPSYREALGYDNMRETVDCLQRAYRDPMNEKASQTAAKTSLGYKQPPYELKVEHRNSDLRILTVLEAPVFDDNGQLTSVEGVMHDVTEDRRNALLVREAQSHLVEAEKLAALGGLMAGISHEINTPIGIGVTASTHLQQLNSAVEATYLRGELSEQGFESFLESSTESARLIQTNLTRAVDLLANFRRVAVDQSAGQERVFNLAEYFTDIMQSLSPRFRNTGFTIRCDCPPDLVMKCDPGALYQILSNLVLNSLNHGFDGLLVGEIVLTAQRRGDEVILDYRDNGVGMTRRQLARIYEPFFTTSRGRGGTGLGMHIVYNNVTQTLGGRISCASKPGKGTRFTISVPLPAEEANG